MYYRRKVLLALTEVFGGSLPSSDCEKLLFTFCQQTGKIHYDFFPLQIRTIQFSLVLRQADDFQTRHNPSTLLRASTLLLERAHPSGQNRFAEIQISNRGFARCKLVRNIYRDFPQYTSRSKIAGRHFSADEINQLQFAWSTDTKPAVFSIGYEGLTIDSFLNKLIANNIIVVVDVRNNPQSMKYEFSKKSLK